MSVTMIRWSETDELALGRVQGQLQAHSAGRTLTRPEVIKLLVRAHASGVPAVELLHAGDRDTMPPTDRGA